MIDCPTKSQIRGWNNDGMDPDWRPESIEFKSEPLEKIKHLINMCGELARGFDNTEVKDNLLNDEYSTRITRDNKWWREFLKAYEEVKFK